MDNETKSQKAIANRWTPKLAESFTAVATIFLEHYHELKISNAEAMFIIHLISYKWGENAPFPSFGELARKMGVTPTAARGYARSLEQKKYLRREMRANKPNVFHLDPLFSRLEEEFYSQDKARWQSKLSKTKE